MTKMKGNCPIWIWVCLWFVLVMPLLTACAARSESTPSVTAADIDGEALYLQVCAECHGERGEGEPNWKVPDDSGIYLAPPHDSSGHTWHHPDDLLLQITAEGGSMPTSNMPAFGEQLSRAEMQAILDYIKTFWGPQERAFQEEITRQGR